MCHQLPYRLLLHIYRFNRTYEYHESGSYHFKFGNITQYCAITFDGKRQVVGEMMACPVQRLVMTFVKIEENGNDRFYILTWQQLRDLLVKGHKAFLQRHDGVRPQRWDSLHSAILEKTLLPYRDKWDTIEKNLK